MHIAPAEQRTLLEIAQLTQAATVPTPVVEPEEAIAVRRSEKEVSDLRSGAAAAQLAVADMELEVRRIQQDESQLRRRLAADRKALGAIEDREERKDLQHDIASTQVRLQDLTSQTQEAHNELHALRQNVDSYGARLDAAEAKLAAAQRALAALPQHDSGAEQQQRLQELRAAVSAPALELFDQRYAENDIGVARLRGRVCEGCAMALPAATVTQLQQAPADSMPECPDCDSYLVREGS